MMMMMMLKCLAPLEPDRWQLTSLPKPTRFGVGPWRGREGMGKEGEE